MIRAHSGHHRLNSRETRRRYSTNTHGAMAALPPIKRRGGGALVHVTSVLGRRSVPLQSPYCASKHGVDGMLESLRVDAATPARRKGQTEDIRPKGPARLREALPAL